MIQEGWTEVFPACSDSEWSAERWLTRTFMHVKQSHSRRRWMETLLNPAEAAVPVALHHNVSSRPASQFPLGPFGRRNGTPETIWSLLVLLDTTPVGGKAAFGCSQRGLGSGGSGTCFTWRWNIKQPPPSVSAGGGPAGPAANWTL